MAKKVREINISWKDILIIIATIFLVFVVVRYFNAKPAEATRNRVCFCHNVQNNPHTICTSKKGKIEGHSRHVKNGRDYNGECRVEPTVTPTPTEPITITKGFSPAGAPPLPECEAPVYRPTVTYLGQDGNTFSYEWTEVKDGLHTYWINYGATADNLPHSIVVQGESVSITMNEDTNWIEVAGYDNGCLGPFSEITN